jgi:hypothetical protein
MSSSADPAACGVEGDSFALGHLVQRNLLQEGTKTSEVSKGACPYGSNAVLEERRTEQDLVLTSARNIQKRGY